MKETLNTVRVGLFCLLGLAVIWIVYETLQEGAVFETKGYTIIGEFEDVKMLRAGDDVRISGVRIGSVIETRLRGGAAEAVFSVDPNIKIAADSVATIAISSVLGSNHIAIKMGDSEKYLVDGDRIATRHTADMNELFAQLGDVTGRIDGLFDDISNAFSAITGTEDEPGALQTLNLVLSENRESLKTTIDNIRDISEKINNGEGTISRLINDSDAYDSLLAAIDEIATAAENAAEMTDGANEIVAHIRSGEGTLGNLIYNDKTSKEIEALATNLRELSDKLVNGEGTLGRLMTDDSLFNDLQAIMQKAERTLDGLNEQGPISAVGIAAGALF